MTKVNALNQEKQFLYLEKFEIIHLVQNLGQSWAYLDYPLGPPLARTEAGEEALPPCMSSGGVDLAQKIKERASLGSWCSSG